MSRGADVLIVGGGIAGWSAAWEATRAGRHVTLVDEGLHRASDLPVALVNPLRGRTGRLVNDGVDGLHATFAMIDALRVAGHRVDAARGLLRPLIGCDAEARVEAFWTARLAGRLAFDWCDVVPAETGLVERVAGLRLREAGWVAPVTLLAALRADCAPAALEPLVDRVVALSKQAHGTRDWYRAELASGASLVARTVLWCGGAWGASLLDRPAGDGLYKPGSLLAIDAPLVREPLSFGLYAVPWTAAPPSTSASTAPVPLTLIGPTREGSQAHFASTPVPPEAVAHLGDRIARTFGTRLSPRPDWRGMRLVRLSSSAAAALAAIPTLTELGSRGFLMAPLRARAWASSLSRSV